VYHQAHLQPLGLDLGEALGEGEEVVQPRLPLPLVVRPQHRHQQLVRLLLPWRSTSKRD
jgi:hypothetical protein